MTVQEPEDRASITRAQVSAEISRASDNEVMSALQVARGLQLDIKIDAHTRTTSRIQLASTVPTTPVHAAAILAVLAVTAGRPREAVLSEIENVLDEHVPEW